MRLLGTRALLAAALAAVVVLAPLQTAAPAAAAGAALTSAPGSARVAPGAMAAANLWSSWTQRQQASVGAGDARTVSLWTGRQKPAGVQALVVQVQVQARAGAGTMTLWAAGGDEPDVPVATFPKGSSSFTTIVSPDDLGRVAVRSTVDAGLTFTVLGHLTPLELGRAGQGGAATVAPTAVVDQASGRGGAVPSVGGTAEVPLAGLAGLPVEGVQAVWVSVLSEADGAGSIAFAGSAALDSAPATVRTGPGARTSLALAPLDADGTLRYQVRGAELRDLQVVVLAWVSDGGGDGTTGGIVPIEGGVVPGLPTTSAIAAIDLGAAGIPSATDGVLATLTVRTGRSSGSLVAGGSLLGLLLGSATSVPLPAGAVTDVVTMVRPDSSGRLYVLLPAGARVESAAVLGYVGVSGPVRSDRDDPELDIVSPQAAAVLQQAESPEVTFTGTASDASSGVRAVEVYANGASLGNAQLRADGASVSWELTSPVPAGTHRVQVTVTDWAGRSTSTTRRFVMEEAPDDAVVVAPDAAVLTDAEARAVTEVTPDRVVLAGATDIRAGDVVVSGISDAAPEGFLRRVTSVEVLGDTAVLTTSQAVLTDVLLQADVHLDGVVLDGQDVVLDESGQSVAEAGAAMMFARGAAPASVGIGHKFTISTPTLRDPSRILSLSASASIGVAMTVDLEIDMDVSWTGIRPELRRFGFVLSQDASIGVTAGVGGRVDLLDERFPLSHVRLGAVTVMAGPVPLVFTNSMQPAVYTKITASGQLSVSLDYTVTSRAGMEYSGDAWRTINERQQQATPSVGLKVSATAEAGLRLGLVVKLYDFVGPELAVSLGVAESASIGANPIGGGSVTLTRTTSLVARLAVAVKVQVLSRTIAEAGQDLGEVRVELHRSVTRIGNDEDPGDGGDPGGGDPGDGGPGDGGEPGDGDPGDGGDPDGGDDGTPAIEEVQPAQGSTEGRVWVDVTGQNLTDVTQVLFGDQPALRFDEYEGRVFALTPEHGPGTVDVTVVTAAGSAATPADARFTYADPVIDVRYRDVSVSPNHLLALTEDGLVHASGAGSEGQLGVANPHYDATVTVPGLTDVAQIATGHFHSLAVTRSGEVYAWGRNEDGELGDGTRTNRAEPRRVQGLPPVVDVAASGHTSVALGVDGSVWTWGVRTISDFGDPERDVIAVEPVRVEGLPAATAVDVGGWFGWGSHVLALTVDGEVWAWGANTYGQLGDGTTDDRLEPAPVPGTSGTTAIAAGWAFSQALGADGALHAWGRNDRGQLGLGDTLDRTGPTRVVGDVDFVDVDAGQVHTIALSRDGTVYTWGWNIYGQVQTDAPPPRSVPRPDVSHDFPRIERVLAGDGYMSLAISSRGVVRVWGEQMHSRAMILHGQSPIPGWYVAPF